MHQLPGATMQDRLKTARTVLRQARAFRQAAQGNLSEGLRLPAISSLHESARLAVSAVAAFDGYRFSNTPGAHEAVVDYAHACKLVDQIQFAQLDQLRDLRHQVNYPADMIEPSEREVEQFCTLVDDVLAAAVSRIPAPKIPPPPKV
jgi:hypothetical protein